MNGVGTSIASTKIPKSAFFRNRAGPSKQQPQDTYQGYQYQPPRDPSPRIQTPTQPRAGPSIPSPVYDRDRDLPPPPSQADTFGRARHAPEVYDEDEPIHHRDDRFTPMPARSTRRQRTTRQDTLGRDALESPPLTVRVEEESFGFTSGSGGSGSGSGLSLGRGTLESSTSTAPTTITVATPALSPTMGSDEMLFALLAGQAAVDCSQLPIGGWEEVEGWKKELELLSTRLEALQARHQREVKILAAARTLQKLNSSHKRMSKATMESLEQSEKRVAEAEKEVLVLRDREAALRRQLMEHWAGVMAWEVRRLERQAADAVARHERQLKEVAEMREREAVVAAEQRDAGPSKESGEIALRREQELLERLRAVEAERDEHAEKARLTAADLDKHKIQSRTLDDKLRDLEAERNEHADRARKAVAELDQHISRARSLEDEREHFTKQTRGLESERDQHASRLRELEEDWSERGRRIAELEEMVLEFGKRERTLGDNARAAQQAVDTVNAEREEWERERSQLVAEREELMDERDNLLKQRDSANRERDDIYHKHGALVAESAQAIRVRDRLTAERDAWNEERQALMTARDGHAAERSKLTEAADKAASQSRLLDGLCADIGRLIGRQVSGDDLPAAIDEVRSLQLKKDQEIASLRDELREVTHGLETEIGRITADRDALRAIADESSSSSTRAMQVEMTELVRKIRAQNETIADLQQQLQSSGQPRSNGDDSATQAALAKAWRILPAPGARADSGLSRGLSPGLSPKHAIDFAALQRAYTHPPEVEYTNVDDLVARIKGVVEDGRIMAERMARMEVEKERHKLNAARAAKLVEDSRHSLETYKHQVETLHKQLAQSSSGSNGSAGDEEVASLRLQLAEAATQIKLLKSELSAVQKSGSASVKNELASLQRDLDHALAENRKLGDAVATRSEAVTRLNEVNDQLSARTLAMADEAEKDKQALTSRHASELETERAKFLEQRVQMLDEMNSLQAEVGELRAKLRR